MRGGIRVYCVCPGYVCTSMQDRELVWEASLRNMTAAKVRAEYVALTPLGRIEELEDVAYVVVFLASDLARFMMGEAVCATGGASTGAPAGAKNSIISMSTDTPTLPIQMRLDQFSG